MVARLRIAVFALGGTIGVTGRRAAVHRSSAAELLAGLPGPPDDCELVPHDFRRMPSANIQFSDVLELIRAARAAEADAVVVASGTDTLEELAYLTDLVWSGDRPIVFTGAMRRPVAPGPDGPANLAAAVRVAASGSAAGLGALVVLHDEVHAARAVTKAHTTSPAAFTSPDTGPIGRVTEGIFRLHGTLRRRVVLPMPEVIDVRVPVHLSVLGDDGVLLPVDTSTIDGLVIAALGGGHLGHAVADRVLDLASQVPVVLASRTGAGRVLSNTYDGPGSETALLGGGLIGAGELSAVKARLLLTVLLANGADRTAIVAAFAAE